MYAPDTWMPVKEFCKLVVWPTEASLRQMIYKKDEFGMDCCIRKFGGRVLINPKLFFDLVADGKSYQEKKKPQSRG